MHYNRSYFLSKQLSTQPCLSHVLLTCTVYSEKSGYERQPAGFVMILLLLCLLKKKPSQVQRGSVKTSCFVTSAPASQMVLAASLTRECSLTTFIITYTYIYCYSEILVLSGLRRYSHRVQWQRQALRLQVQFLASSSSYLWLLIPTPTASFPLRQHKHFCTRAGNQIGESIPLKITFFYIPQVNFQAEQFLLWQGGGKLVGSRIKRWGWERAACLPGAPTSGYAALNGLGHKVWVFKTVPSLIKGAEGLRRKLPCEMRPSCRLPGARTLLRSTAPHHDVVIPPMLSLPCQEHRHPHTTTPC